MSPQKMKVALHSREHELSDGSPSWKSCRQIQSKTKKKKEASKPTPEVHETVPKSSQKRKENIPKKKRKQES